MSATTGRDTIEGSDGPDTIDGLGGGDLIFARNGNDTIVSYADSTIFGAGGNDLFLSRPFTPGDPNDLMVRDDLTGVMLDGGDHGTDEFDRPWQDTYLLTRLAAQFGVTLPFVNIERLAIRPPASTFLAYGTASADYYDFYGRSISIVNFSTGNPAFLELRAGEGSDVVFAPSNAAGNYIYGGNDNDFLYGYSAPDFLYGEEGNDFLSGGANNDELYGGNGNDCMIGGPGADTFFGGTANDVFVVLAGDAAVTAELMAEAVDGVMADGSFDMVFEEIGEGSDTILASVSYTLPPARMPGPFMFSFLYSEVEALVLTGTDNINGTGNAFAQLVQGNSGNNSMDGRGGADTLVGDAGHDTLHGGTGTISGISINDNDSLLGGEGDDWLIGDIGNDTIDGGIGNDWASYATASTGVTINLATGASSGAHGEDRLVSIEAAIGGLGNDSLFGNAGDNTLAGGAGGFDRINAGGGLGDLVYFEGAAISVSLAVSYRGGISFGFDYYNTASVTRGGVTIADVIGAEIIQATPGNDLIEIFGTLEKTPVFFDGAGGNDTISNFTSWSSFFVDYRSGSATTGANVDLAAGTGRDRHGSTDRLDGIQNVAGSNLGDTILGNDNDNIFRPYNGRDLLDGRLGNDMVDYGATDGPVSVNLAIGRGFNALGGDADTLIGIENLRGGNGSDTLIGDAADNVLGGADGSNSLDGGAGNDTADYSTAASAVTVNLGSERAQNGQGGTDTLSGFEAARGSSFNDSLLGSSLADSLFGNAGSDTFTGGDGNDLLDGGDGLDSLRGGGGDDAIFAGMDNDILDGENGNDRLFGEGGDDSLSGGSGRDSLAGGDGADTVSGGADNDSLHGGGGADSLLGGDGNDAISFSSSGIGGATVLGEAHNDTITGDAFMTNGPFMISGGTGDDLLRVQSSGGVTISGGEGNDTLELLSSSFSGSFAKSDAVSGLVITANAGAPLSLTNVTGIDAINLTGSSQTLTLSAAIINTISDSGRLAVYGDANSNVTFSDSGWVRGTTNNGLVTFTNGGVSLTASQSLVGGGGGGGGGPTEGNDNLTGTASADALNGLGGNDSISGLDGSDTINGSAGADTMDGGAGNDLFYVDNALDLVLEALGGGNDSIISSVSYAMPNHVEQIRIADGVTGITITGSSGADIIIGNGLAINLNAGAGDDIILGQNIALADILALFALP